MIQTNDIVFVLSEYNRELGVSFTVSVVSSPENASKWINDRYEVIGQPTTRQWDIEGGYILAIEWKVDRL